MHLRDWRQLSPEKAAKEIRRRIANLPAGQQRAVIASVPAEATLIEALAQSDRTAPLGGVPYFLKDLFDVAHLPTFAGSAFLPEVREATSTRDGTIVRALRQAGAVFAGKTHLHEFAYGITGENPHYGDCEHPRFPGRTTGGSSSGSAAIVAAGIAPLAIGTDTGGSVRVPAAFCGLYGYRGSPRDALIGDAFPLSQSLDTAGWFTSSAADMDTVLATLIAPRAAVNPPRGCYLELPDMEREVVGACAAAAGRFAPSADELTRAELLGAFVDSVDIYSRIVAAEAWNIHQSWAEKYRDRYDPAVWQRLQRGADQAPSAYAQAFDERAAVQSVWSRFFERFDFLVLPATPFGALTKADCTLANRNRLLRLTAPASLGGYPVLTIPVPLASGLTCGLQVVVRDATSPVLPWALARA